MHKYYIVYAFQNRQGSFILGRISRIWYSDGSGRCRDNQFGYHYSDLFSTKPSNESFTEDPKPRQPDMHFGRGRKNRRTRDQQPAERNIWRLPKQNYFMISIYGITKSEDLTSNHFCKRVLFSLDGFVLKQALVEIEFRCNFCRPETKQMIHIHQNLLLVLYSIRQVKYPSIPSGVSLLWTIHSVSCPHCFNIYN